MARPRKPDHLKIVAGTARPHRMNPNAPAASSRLPTPPAWLSSRAAEIFLSLVGVIDRMGIASADDTAMLAVLASRLEEIEATTAVIEDLGRTYIATAEYDDQGRVVKQYVRARPEVGMRSEAMRHAQALLNDFGLSPASRSKVSVTAKPEANPFLALSDDKK